MNSQPSKVMLLVIHNRMTPSVKELVVEDQIGFCAGTEISLQQSSPLFRASDIQCRGRSGMFHQCAVRPLQELSTLYFHGLQLHGACHVNMTGTTTTAKLKIREQSVNLSTKFTSIPVCRSFSMAERLGSGSQNLQRRIQTLQNEEVNESRSNLLHGTED